MVATMHLCASKMLSCRVHPFCQSQSVRPILHIVAAYNQGFGKTNKKSSQAPDLGSYTASTRSRTRKSIAEELNDQKEAPASTSKPAVDLKQGWKEVGTVDALFQSKPVKAVDVGGGKVLVVYRTAEGEVFCSEAESTAYKFPLVDAKILQGKDGPSVEVPLDGTVYSLRTGKVEVWCPRNNPVRGVLGLLKNDVPPTDLKMYQTSVLDGKVYIKPT